MQLLAFWLLATSSAKAHYWLMINLLSMRIPKTFSAKRLSALCIHNIHWCTELFLPRCRTFCFPLLNSIGFPFAFSPVCYDRLNSSKTILSINHSSQLLSSANLLTMYLVPSSRSLPKMLNRIRICIDPWDRMLVTGLHLDFMPVIAATGSSASFQCTSLVTPMSRTVCRFIRSW